MKFKHNDRVTCTILGTKITDARISLNKDGMPFICQNVFVGSAAEDKLGYGYSLRLSRDFRLSGLTDLKLATPTWDTLAFEDVLVSKYGDKRKVLAILNNGVWLSLVSDFEESFGWLTKKELQKEGYTIEGAAPAVEEITVTEAEARFGIKIKLK